jgi:hypothetical protein
MYDKIVESKAENNLASSMKENWRKHQEHWKNSSPMIPDDARSAGFYVIEENGRRREIGPYEFCLKPRYANYNLLPSIREEAIELFAKSDIEWHNYTEGPDGRQWPSTHLLDSQVQCVNILLSLCKNNKLIEVIRSVEPSVDNLICLDNGLSIEFEWIGKKNYLGEFEPRKRGKYATSADAFIVAATAEKRIGFFIEWKFTESGEKCIPFKGYRHDKREIYRKAFSAPDSPFNEDLDLDEFFRHESYYQLMRLALLARASVSANEFGITSAMVLHMVPHTNWYFRKMVPEKFIKFGADLPSVWEKILRDKSVKYRCVSTESYFRATPEIAHRYSDGPCP